jgi:hypothetical protein
MTEPRYVRGPSFVAILQRLMGNGRTFAEAEKYLLRRINAGEFMVDKHISLSPPILHLRLMSHDRLYFETAKELIDVTDIFTLEPVRAPEKLEACADLAAKASAVLGGGLPKPPADPHPPKPVPIAQRRKKVEVEATAHLMTKPDLETVDRDYYKLETLKRFANSDPPLSENGYYRALMDTGRTWYGPRPQNPPNPPRK